MIQTNFFPQPEKDKPIKIIQISPSGLQPRKVEEISYKNCADVLPDTYILYPTGGYHPFYRVPNTFPRYQLPIWPFIKRIKWFTKPGEKREGRRPEIAGQIKSLINPKRQYVFINMQKKGYYMMNRYTRPMKKNGLPEQSLVRNSASFDLHILVGNAYIPNPEKKPFVMHINDDPTNYLPENLIWGTPGENMKGVKKLPDTMQHKYLNFVNQGLIKG